MCVCVCVCLFVCVCVHAHFHSVLEFGQIWTVDDIQLETKPIGQLDQTKASDPGSLAGTLGEAKQMLLQPSGHPSLMVAMVTSLGQ